MQIFRSKTTVALASAAALSLATTPVMARDGYRDHDDGISAGGIFAGLLIIGGIAAVATAASKSKRDRQAGDDRRYRDGDYRDDGYRDGDYRAPPPAYGDAGRDSPPAAGYRDEQAADRTIDYGDARSDQADRDQPAGAGRQAYGVDGAVDACVSEVQRGNRSVETIDGVNREADGWRVGGRVAGNYGFSCVVDRNGRVKSVEGL